MYIAQSLIFALTVSIFVTLFGLNASNYLLGVMGSDAEGIALTREYLDIIFYGTFIVLIQICLLYTSPSPRDQRGSRMPSSA